MKPTSTYARLVRDFGRRVATLQRACPHAKSTWMEHWWAWGHPSGYRVRMCDACHKTLEEDPPKAVRDAAEADRLKDFAALLRKAAKKQSPIRTMSGATPSRQQRNRGESA